MNILAERPNCSGKTYQLISSPSPCLCCLLFPNKPKQCLTAWAPWSALLPSSSASLSTRATCYKGQSPHIPGGTIGSRSIERTRGGIEPRRDPGADQGVLKCTLPLLLPQLHHQKMALVLEMANGVHISYTPMSPS